VLATELFAHNVDDWTFPPAAAIGDDPPKFSKQVVGKNKLGRLVKEMCKRAGFSSRYTNHCSSAVRAHKRPGVAHDMLVSAILQPPKKSKLDDEQCVLPSVPIPLGECSKQLPQGVDPLFKRQVWNSPFQLGMDKPHNHSLKEKYPSPHNLPVVLNFNFGRC